MHAIFFFLYRDLFSEVRASSDVFHVCLLLDREKEQGTTLSILWHFLTYLLKKRAGLDKQQQDTLDQQITDLGIPAVNLLKDQSTLSSHIDAIKNRWETFQIDALPWERKPFHNITTRQCSTKDFIEEAWPILVLIKYFLKGEMQDKQRTSLLTLIQKLQEQQKTLGGEDFTAPLASLKAALGEDEAALGEDRQHISSSTPLQIPIVASSEEQRKAVSLRIHARVHEMKNPSAFSRLPPELLQQILKHLPPGDLNRCMRVSTQLQQVVINGPTLDPAANILYIIFWPKDEDINDETTAECRGRSKLPYVKYCQLAGITQHVSNQCFLPMWNYSSFVAGKAKRWEMRSLERAMWALHEQKLLETTLSRLSPQQQDRCLRLYSRYFEQKDQSLGVQYFSAHAVFYLMLCNSFSETHEPINVLDTCRSIETKLRKEDQSLQEEGVFLSFLSYLSQKRNSLDQAQKDRVDKWVTALSLSPKVTEKTQDALSKYVSDINARLRKPQKNWLNPLAPSKLEADMISTLRFTEEVSPAVMILKHFLPEEIHNECRRSILELVQKKLGGLEVGEDSLDSDDDALALKEFMHALETPLSFNVEIE